MICFKMFTNFTICNVFSCDIATKTPFTFVRMIAESAVFCSSLLALWTSSNLWMIKRSYKHLTTFFTNLLCSFSHIFSLSHFVPYSFIITQIDIFCQLFLYVIKAVFRPPLFYATAKIAFCAEAKSLFPSIYDKNLRSRTAPLLLVGVPCPATSANALYKPQALPRWFCRSSVSL